MKGIKGLSLLLALSLAGCGWFHSSPPPDPPAKGPGVAANNGEKDPPPPTCTCDAYPYPPACTSSCDVGEAKIVSIDPKTRTAVVTIKRGTQVVQRTIALTSLPTGVPVEAGAKFAALYKRDIARPENSPIVRFSAKAP